MKKFAAALISLLIPLGSALVAQDKKAEEKPAESRLTDQIYQEIVLEDFENVEFTNKNLEFSKTNEQEGYLKIRSEADNAVPAPFNNSKKFLGLKVYARKGDHFTITPARPLIIEKYCRSIGVWVYGKRFAAELSVMIQDVEGNIFKLNLGTMDFLGWRKIEVKIPTRARQQDEYLNRKTSMKIIKLIYSPKNATQIPMWQTLYIDDITARVREKYSDRQSDDW